MKKIKITVLALLAATLTSCNPYKPADALALKEEFGAKEVYYDEKVGMVWIDQDDVLHITTDVLCRSDNKWALWVDRMPINLLR